MEQDYINRKRNTNGSRNRKMNKKKGKGNKLMLPRHAIINCVCHKYTAGQSSVCVFSKSVNIPPVVP